MHVAFFTNTYHPVVNGVVQSIHDFRYALTGHGHQVFVFAQHVKNHKDKEPFIFRYPAFKWPTRQEYPLTIPLSPFVDWVLPSLKLDVIHSHHLPPTLQTSDASDTVGVGSLQERVSLVERDIIVDALKRTNGNLTAAARDLASTPRIITYKVKELGIDYRRYRRKKR